MGKIRIKNALISVSNKEGLHDLVTELDRQGVRMISTGGTAEKIRRLGFTVTPIEEVTQNPEILNGRVKTLSMQISAGILFNRDHEGHKGEMDKLKIEGIDLVVCNLYPFKDKCSDANDQELVEWIDVGGPTMIRAAAKNHAHVCVVTDPKQYPKVCEYLAHGVPAYLREQFAVEAFRITAEYDQYIARELANRSGHNSETNPIITKTELFQKGTTLRYGENSHQRASLIKVDGENGLPTAEILQGRPLSYNNLCDANEALECCRDVALVGKEKTNWDNVTAAIVVKHQAPCGAALGINNLKTLEQAFKDDLTSSFGGVVAITGTIDEEMAEYLRKKFIEVLVAEDITDKAKEILSKKEKLRVLICPIQECNPQYNLRSLSGGILIQESDQGIDQELECVSSSRIDEELWPLLHFTIMCNKHLKSNALALGSVNADGIYHLLAQGSGRPNRVDCIDKLIAPTLKNHQGWEAKSVLASDAFFPFGDSIQSAHALGIQNIVAPRGSMRDKEVIDKANELGVNLVFSGRRHFKH